MEEFYNGLAVGGKMRTYTVNKHKQNAKMLLLVVVMLLSLIYFGMETYKAYSLIPDKPTLTYKETSNGVVIEGSSFTEQLTYQARQQDLSYLMLINISIIAAGGIFFYLFIHRNCTYVVDDNGIRSYSMNNNTEPRVDFEWDNIKSIQIGYTYGSGRRYPVYGMNIRFQYESSTGKMLQSQDILPMFRMEDYKDLKLYLKQMGEKVGVEVFEMDS